MGLSHYDFGNLVIVFEMEFHGINVGFELKAFDARVFKLKREKIEKKERNEREEKN